MDYPPNSDAEPTPTPTQTPNVVLANPVTRKALNWVVGIAALVVPTVAIIDGASADLDWSSWTIPAMAATLYAAGILGIVVTTPNIPSVK